MRRTIRWTAYLAAIGIAVVATAALTWAFLSRNLPELQPWHRYAPPSEGAAGDLGPSSTLSDYLAREARIFDELAAAVTGPIARDAPSAMGRYSLSSPLNPLRFERNWNRTFEITPPSVRGGALLVHGLTDAPYSLRSVAEILAAEGYYVLALRMPGHGTTPGALARARWPDWAAAVRLGVRHIRGKVGPTAPLVLAGYSNGGALVVHYALDALVDSSLPRVDRLVLFSPMIGVSPLARLSWLLPILSGLPYFERSAWTSVQPEYNPFKYTSFPAMAGEQSFLMTREVQRRIEAARTAGRLAEMPPVLTFQSLADATVITAAVVDGLYASLSGNGSALVLFDLNRQLIVRALVSQSFDALLNQLTAAATPYRLTLLTNASSHTLDVVARDRVAEATTTEDQATGLAWPRDVFSMSHVAVPFPVTDPLYGLEPDVAQDFGVRLGTLAPRGEHNVLVVGVADLMRLSSNPFFPYMAERLKEWVR
jgi:alpha-beta hydrolase superfamily lysophospholipase